MLMPWKTAADRTLREAITGFDVKTTRSLDVKMVSICRPVVRTGHVYDSFQSYFESPEHYDNDTIFGKIIPTINRLIMEAHRTMADVVVAPLPQNRTESHAYTRIQIATMIAYMWYNGYNYEYMGKANMDKFAEPTFKHVFAEKNTFALACILRYFYYVSENIDNAAWRRQSVVYRRFHQRDAPSSGQIRGIGYVEDTDYDDVANGVLHIVPANYDVGGWTFKNACTYEETIMLVRPECLLLLLIAPAPGDYSLNAVIGAEKISQFNGFGTSLKYAGAYPTEDIERVTVGDMTVMQIAHVFVPVTDATAIHTLYITNFEEDIRRLTLALRAVPIHGGCATFGSLTYSFNGCPQDLRVLQMTIASAYAGVQIAQCTHNKELIENLKQFNDWAQGRDAGTVQQMYGAEIREQWRIDGMRMSTLVLNMMCSLQ